MIRFGSSRREQPSTLPVRPSRAKTAKLRSCLGRQHRHQGTGGGSRFQLLRRMYLLAIASAQKTLRIDNAYFLPDDLTRKELINAAKRGVKVEIIVPGKLIDQKLVRAASKRQWPELLKANAKIYEYQPTMVHVKLMIVDGAFVSVGAGNFDNRSISPNDEANLDVLDRNFAVQQTRLF